MKARLAKLQKALSSTGTFDALEKVRALIPDDGAGAHEVVVYGFACILETSSAGLSILFDRFDDDELGRIRGSLESIGATRTLTALRKLEKAFERALGKGKAREDAADSLTLLPDAQRVDRQSADHVDEMQRKLLEFCKAHVRELAAG